MAQAALLPDGTTDFSGGQNAAVKPDQIGANQFFTGVNVSTEKGVLVPRWGIEEQVLDWSIAGNYTQQTGLEIPFEEVFNRGKNQAIITYSIGPDKYVIYIVGGFFFLIDSHSLIVTVLNPTDPVNPDADRINWSNAGIYLVIYDFPNVPFILEGITTRRSDPTVNEVPVSVLGAYNQNRLCIANAGIDWTAGDPAGSIAAPDAPITFIEVNTGGSPYVGDVYQVPTANRNNDVITAMGFLQVLDKSTEIGPLLVSTAKAIYHYRTDLPRSLWQGGTADYVFGSVLLYSAGIIAQRAFINVNSDIIFKSSDGQVRALSMARNEQRLWGNSPISKEVSNFLELIDIDLGKFSTVSYFKNKIFVTCNPHRTTAVSPEGIEQTDYINGGVVVIEADNIATLSNPNVAPVWAGLWTGVRFVDFADVDGEMYISAKDGGRNKLYKFTPERTYDVIEGKKRVIRSVIETKAYAHTDNTKNKKLHHVELGLNELKGEVKLDIYYKPSTYENYLFWKTAEFSAPFEQCEAFPEFPNGLAMQGIRDFNSGGVIIEECDESSKLLLYVFKDVQLRLILTGEHWELNYIKVMALLAEESQTDPYCKKKKAVRIGKECFDYWYIPSLDNC